MKLFTTRQIAEIDKYTIENEPISDLDLMERAATEMFLELESAFDYDIPLVFFAGPGNNGGDALAMARLFAKSGHPCTVYLLDTGKPLKGSPAANWDRLTPIGNVSKYIINSEADFPFLDPACLVFDGLFGSGLKRPLEGLPAALVKHINKSKAKVYAIDIPSGMHGEENPGGNPHAIIKADMTLTLQFPKISLLFPENEPYIGKLKIIDIGLHPFAIEKTETPYRVSSAYMIRQIIPKRKRYDHKGTFGHALLIAGSYGKMGAALLAARGCVRAGAGLTTAHIPKAGYEIMQTSNPEVMVSIDRHDHFFSSPEISDRYTAIGIGPGLGTSTETVTAFGELLAKCKVPMVVDADALNILASQPGWLAQLPKKSILTPHPGEFNRLFGNTTNSWQRLQLLRDKAMVYGITIVLKGAWTAIAYPDGTVSFNPTGNPGMATGGSGDVLTGIILGLLAQGISPEKSAEAGVYLHGLAGDLAARKISMPALIASDIIDYLGKAFMKINQRWQQDF